MKYDRIPERIASWHVALCALLTGSLLALAPVAGAQSAEVTLRLGHATLVTHPFQDASVRFRNAVRARTHGAVDIQIFPARQLGDEAELYNNVKLGTVDLSLASVSAVPAEQPLQYPWLIGGYDDLIKVYQLPETRAMLEPKFAADGLEMLSLYEGGRFQFLTVDKTIKTIDDFQGLKTRVPPSKLQLDIWKAIGANPTPIAYGEIYTALQTGTIDALGINLTSIYSEKFYEVGKRVLLTNSNYWPTVLVINKSKLKSLKPEYQEAIRAAALETTAPQIHAVQSLENDLINKLKAKGVEFSKMTPELKAALKAKAKPVIERYSKGKPEVVKFVDAAERAQR